MRCLGMALTTWPKRIIKARQCSCIVLIHAINTCSILHHTFLPMVGFYRGGILWLHCWLVAMNYKRAGIMLRVITIFMDDKRARVVLCNWAIVNYKGAWIMLWRLCVVNNKRARIMLRLLLVFMHNKRSRIMLFRVLANSLLPPAPAMN